MDCPATGVNAGSIHRGGTQGDNMSHLNPTRHNLNSLASKLFAEYHRHGAVLSFDKQAPQVQQRFIDLAKVAYGHITFSPENDNAHRQACME